jgi:hypothetical protein
MTAHDVAIAGSWAVREAQARQRAASRIDRPYSKESMAENLLEKTRSGGNCYTKDFCDFRGCKIF